MGILFVKRLGILVIGLLLVLVGCQILGLFKGEFNKIVLFLVVEEDFFKM